MRSIKWGLESQEKCKTETDMEGNMDLLALFRKVWKRPKLEFSDPSVHTKQTEALSIFIPPGEVLKGMAWKLKVKC